MRARISGYKFRKKYVAFGNIFLADTEKSSRNITNRTRANEAAHSWRKKDEVRRLKRCLPIAPIGEPRNVENQNHITGRWILKIEITCTHIERRFPVRMENERGVQVMWLIEIACSITLCGYRTNYHVVREDHKESLSKMDNKGQFPLNEMTVDVVVEDMEKNVARSQDITASQDYFEAR